MYRLVVCVERVGLMTDFSKIYERSTHYFLGLVTDGSNYKGVIGLTTR
jgi:hypothetical protein